MTSVDFSASYPDRPEPLSDALRLPEVDLSVFDEGDADGEVAALVQQLHVVNLGHPQLKKGRRRQLALRIFRRSLSSSVQHRTTTPQSEPLWWHESEG